MPEQHDVRVRDREPLEWWLGIDGVDGVCEMKGCPKRVELAVDLVRTLSTWVSLLCRGHGELIVEHPEQFGLDWSEAGRPSLTRASAARSAS